jgi:predicted ArsR family transcriptional regulator
VTSGVATHLGVGGSSMVDPDPHRLLQRQARALGDPTRYRIFRYVAEATEPVSVAEITAHVDLHHNGVRQHLAKLCDAGLLLEETVRGGPGRPSLRYRLGPAGPRFMV